MFTAEDWQWRLKMLEDEIPFMILFHRDHIQNGYLQDDSDEKDFDNH